MSPPFIARSVAKSKLALTVSKPIIFAKTITLSIQETMSSVPSSTSARSNPAKRHSLSIYTGPRRLHLVNGPEATAATEPTTAPIIPTWAADHPPTPHTRTTPRRHPSISYKRSSYDSLNQVFSASEADFALRPQNRETKPRPRSFAYPSASLLVPGDRRSLGPGTSSASLSVEDRPPLTLAEKHADLLHFIAQKESKCLELRSQLVMHEAELLQLKRNWERIIRRSFESPHSFPPNPSASVSPASSTTHSPPTTYTSASILGQNPTSPSGTTNVVLEGIKESVHGMGRLIAAGLSIVNDHPHLNSSPSKSPLKPKHRPQSLYSYSPSSSYIRSSNLSTSSTSTTTTSATKSSDTRYSVASVSSASSFFEEEVPTHHESKREYNVDAGESGDSSVDSSSCSQELMVRDTGATPTVSPNPKFKFGADRRKRGKKERESRGREYGTALDGNVDENDISIPDGYPGEAERDGVEVASSSAVDASNTQCHRRKSRESSHAPMRYPHPEDDLITPHTSSPSHPNPSLVPPSSLPSFKTTRSASVQGITKRSSLAGMLAPVSSIPGLSLAESTAILIRGDSNASASGSGTIFTSNDDKTFQNQLPSSWMGINTSKGWNSATLSKGQKRASLLLSDVSQTLASALSLASGTGSSTWSGSGSSTSPSLGSFSPLPTPPETVQASPSLLDQDDDEGFFSTAAALEPMKPMVVTSGLSTCSSAGTGMKTETRITKGETEDEDSEWNW
ncbi:hypothetical protein AX15_001648 [Amanita polypyramis BW_CC]|nr:hypothetical protein AX15_001648 [Amanita polypyramis BW_CC]